MINLVAYSFFKFDMSYPKLRSISDFNGFVDILQFALYAYGKQHYNLIDWIMFYQTSEHILIKFPQVFNLTALLSYTSRKSQWKGKVTIIQ